MKNLSYYIHQNLTLISDMIIMKIPSGQDKVWVE